MIPKFRYIITVAGLLIVVEIVAIMLDKEVCVKGLDVPTENIPYPSPHYTLSGIVATTNSTLSL
jgi:hypothetical protein